MSEAVLSSFPQAVIQISGHLDQSVKVRRHVPSSQQVLYVIAEAIQEDAPEGFVVPARIGRQNAEINRVLRYTAIALAAGEKAPRCLLSLHQAIENSPHLLTKEE